MIGRSVALAVLRPVTGLADAELFDALAQLRNADLLYDLPPFDMGVLAFRHPLIQEVAYSMQLRSRLSNVHVAVAKAIEALDWGSQDEFAALIASHYEFAGQIMQAVEHLQRAARWIGRTNTAESLRLWRKARSMLQALPQSEHVDQLRALASAQILNCGWREGISAEEVKPFAEEAMRYARSTDKMHEPLVIGAYGRVLASTGAVDDYVTLAQNAVKLTFEEGDVGPYATVNAMLAQAFFMSGRLNEALSAVETASAAIAEHGGFDGNVTLGLNPNQLLGFDIGYWIKCLKARTLVQFGRFTEAEPLVAELLQADAEMAPVVRFIPHFASVEMAWARGQGDLLRRHAACVADIAKQSDMPYIRVLSLFGLSLSDAVAGDLAAAVDRLHDTIAFARRVKAALEFEARMLAGYADLLFRAGRLDEALDVSQQAIDLGRLRTDRIAELQGSLLRGLIRASSSALRDDREARDLLERSERLLDVSAAGIYQPLLVDLRSTLERAR